jgi:hypothetical protein
MLAFSSKYGIAAIVDIMPLARVNEAFERVRLRSRLRGRLQPVDFPVPAVAQVMVPSMRRSNSFISPRSSPR